MIGCCEGASGVCCKDKIHCCPQNFSCSDLSQGCKPLQHFVITSTKEVPLHSPNNIVCKDGVTQCPDHTTCCLLSPGGYGCCDYPNARCCSDKTHCCPQGYDCTEGTNKCKRGSHFLSVRTILPRQNRLCEDNKTMCNNDQKCCKQINGTYACCPAGSPFCCSTFCCPEDASVCCGKYCCKECNTATMKCKENSEIPYHDMKHIHVIKATTLIQPKILSYSNGDRFRCSVLQRSCKQGCCPEKNGTCCSNKKYCCPKNYSCKSDHKCIMIKF